MQNKQINVQIKKGSIDEAVNVSLQIPELENPHRKEIYEERLSGKLHLILIAYDAEKPIGFKVGYHREDTLYTWMGGVLPEFRKRGVADELAKVQEEWAKKNGFKTVTLKTRNRHQGMLIFAIKNNFKIIDIDPREPIDENRILLRKNL